MYDNQFTKASGHTLRCIRRGRGQGSGRGRLVTAPVRAQAELLSRLKYVRLADGDVVMARGSARPTHRPRMHHAALPARVWVC